MSTVAKPVPNIRDQPELLTPPGRVGPARGRLPAGAAARLPAWPLAITFALVGGALLPASPLRDAETLGTVDTVRLALPPAYIALAPLCDVLDALTMLSARQHGALLGLVALLYLLWRARVMAGRPRRRWRPQSEGLVFVAALAGVTALYAFGAIVPRPMAALAVDDPDLLIVDFHSHTNASHDGRRRFDADDNRRWHREAGFHAAYVTDHKTIDGAVSAAHANPQTAGEDVVLLQGIEIVYRRGHVNVLGAPAELIANGIASGLGSRLSAEYAWRSGDAPVFVRTLPADLTRVPTPGAEGPVGMTAIELADGAPRAIGQVQRERALLLRIADSLNLALVAGSNNHGWGHTASAWSLMRVPGWRALSPDSLGRMIEHTLRTQRRYAVRVVERRRPDSDGSMLVLATTAPLAAWQIAASLSMEQRVSWFAWVWALALFPRVWTRRRRARLRLVRRRASRARRRVATKPAAGASRSRR